MIEAGVEQDQAYVGKADAHDRGLARSGADADRDPVLAADRGRAVDAVADDRHRAKDADGHWYAREQYACGIAGLAGGCVAGDAGGR